MEQSESEKWYNCSKQTKYVFRSELTAVHYSFLENELESCQLLLEEEPDNKWTLLTIVLLMRAINPIKYADEVEEHLKRLCEIDHYRKEYYSDLDSKYKLENSMERHFTQVQDECSRSIQLTNMNLSCLYHMEQLLLVKDINLSQNKLRNLDECKTLQCARKLCVDNNRLDVIVREGTLNLPWLEELSLNNNNICNTGSLATLQDCKNLRELNLKNNPVENTPNWRQELKTILPQLEMLNGEIL